MVKKTGRRKKELREGADLVLSFDPAARKEFLTGNLTIKIILKLYNCLIISKYRFNPCRNSNQLFLYLNLPQIGGAKRKFASKIIKIKFLAYAQNSDR